MRILVCGGRDYKNKDYLFARLSAAHILHGHFSYLINGGASGADILSTLWAHLNNVPFKEFLAKWDDLEVQGAVIKLRNGREYNSMAGFDRNQKMLDEGKPEMIIAFLGGNGTADMVDQALERNIPVTRFLD